MALTERQESNVRMMLEHFCENRVGEKAGNPLEFDPMWEAMLMYFVSHPDEDALHDMYEYFLHIRRDETLDILRDRRERAGGE